MQDQPQKTARLLYEINKKSAAESLESLKREASALGRSKNPFDRDRSAEMNAQIRELER